MGTESNDIYEQVGEKIYEENKQLRSEIKRLKARNKVLHNDNKNLREACNIDIKLNYKQVFELTEFRAALQIIRDTTCSPKDVADAALKAYNNEDTPTPTGDV